jgi:apolipoprotein N-acyltransferase
VPLLWLLARSRPRRGFALGFAFGVAYFGAVLYWVLLFGGLAWSALVLASSGFVGAFGMLVPALWRPERPARSVVGVAALWTAIEWLRGMWPVGGFTWGGLGTTQTGDRTLIRLASVTGAWGISFVVMAVAAAILMVWEHRASRRLVLAGIAAIPVMILAPGMIPIPRPNGPALEIATIQVDVRAARGLPPAAEDRAVARMNLARHLALPPGAVDLAVWGESALDPGANAPWFRARVVDAIREIGVPTLAGAVVHAPDGRYYNESLLFDGSGRIVGEYRKVHLVPYGEYVPFRRWLSWISALRQIPYDETPGTRVHTLRVDGLTFGNVICFENSFASIDRTLVADGAQFLVVTTNNASYGTTAASRQHLLMSQLRAVENARWVVHAAVSGISAFIDPEGRVVDQRGLFRPATMLHTIRASSAETLYTRLGDWWAWLSLTVALGLLVAPRTGRRGRSTAPLPERPRTLVILPTFNERETIEWVLQRLLALPEPIDVLVVDDSSPDGTGELVRALAAGDPRVRLVERPGKAGLATAYLLGFQVAIREGYDLIVEMDSDLSHEPEELPGLLASARSHDLVIGSRYVQGGSVTNWSRARVALSRAGNLYARFMLGFPIRDATSGFRVYRRGVLERLTAEPIRSDGYGFQIELAFRAWREGFDVAEHPITFREREHGHSKISRRIVLEALWLVTVWGLRARLGTAPRLAAERP